VECWQVGKTKITKIVELVELIQGTTMIKQATTKNVKLHPQLAPQYASKNGELVFSIHAFIIQTRSCNIIVDTCLGEGKKSSIPHWNNLQSRFLHDLAIAGFQRDNIDYVLCTHLHEDHVGWNTMKINNRWQPTFPNAKYLFSEKEWKHWQNKAYTEEILHCSLQPLVKNKLEKLITIPYQLNEEVSLFPTPGHTPGHVSIKISSEGKTAIITGDIMHSPIQCCEPYWQGSSDQDPPQATKTRLEFLQAFSEKDVLILGTHFPQPSGGKIRKNNAVWRFQSHNPTEE